MRTIWLYIFFRLLYAGVLAWFSYFYLFDSRNELGHSPGYVLLLCGVLPSLLLIPLTLRYARVAQKIILIYGLAVLLGFAVFAIIGEGFLWFLVAFPMLGFSIEAIVLRIRGLR